METCILYNHFLEAASQPPLRYLWKIEFLWLLWFDGNHLSPMQFTLGADGKKVEPESNVLLASVENMQYAVTLDVLQTVTTFPLEKASRIFLLTMAFSYWFLPQINGFISTGLFSFWACPEDCHVWQEWGSSGFDTVSW